MKTHLSRKEKLQMLTLSFPQNFYTDRTIQPEIRNLLSPLIKSICILLFLSWLNNRKAQRWRRVLWWKHWMKTSEEGIQFLLLSQDFLRDLVLLLFALLSPTCKSGYFYTLSHSLRFSVGSWAQQGQGSLLKLLGTRPLQQGGNCRDALLSCPPADPQQQGHDPSLPSPCGTSLGTRNTTEVQGNLQGFSVTHVPIFPRGNSKAILFSRSWCHFTEHGSIQHCIFC